MMVPANHNGIYAYVYPGGAIVGENKEEAEYFCSLAHFEQSRGVRRYLWKQMKELRDGEDEDAMDEARSTA